MLSDVPEECQHFFRVLPKFSLKRFEPQIRVRWAYGGQVSRIWNSLLSRLARRYLSRLYLLSRCSHQLDSRM